jgi:dTDP-4-amino-4,6-dideoxygalactose transaminase
MGDAGMMCARDEAGAEKLRMLRVHGSKVRYYHDLVGTNSRLDSIQAAILRIKLKHLSEYEANRKKIATHYIRCLQEAGLGEAVRLPIFDPKRKHVWNQFTVRVQRRDSLRSYLADKGIGSEIYYPLPMHLQKSFASSGFKSGDLPVCEKMAEEVLSLPMFPELSLQDVETVVANIKDFYKK